MDIKNETEWLNEDIEALTKLYRGRIDTVTVTTIWQPGRRLDRMDLWGWDINRTAMRIRLMSRKRLEESVTALERLANPEWVSMSRDLTYGLVQTIIRGGDSARQRAYDPRSTNVPADFATVLRMPTKRKTVKAPTFTVEEVERDLTEAKRRLHYCQGSYVETLARLEKEQAEMIEKSNRRISKLEKRLEKAKRGACKPA
jgi:hypothetical protein